MSAIPSSFNETVPLNRGRALRLAFTVWLVCVGVAFGCAGTTLAFGWPQVGEPLRPIGVGWAVLNIFLVGIVIPISFAIHWRMFRRYWRPDGTVAPDGYLKASVIPWLTMATVVVIMSVNGMMRGSVMPDLILILALLTLLLLTWPNGWSMTHPVPYSEEDDEQDLLHLPPTPHV
jgi:hypothetical protein